jgi:hypothetical protein
MDVRFGVAFCTVLFVILGVAALAWAIRGRQFDAEEARYAVFDDEDDGGPADGREAAGSASRRSTFFFVAIALVFCSILFCQATTVYLAGKQRVSARAADR